MRMLKHLGSLLICLHLIAIAIAPMSMAPASETMRTLWSWCQPYLQLAYLDHGYHFFAPEPGPSSMLEYKASRSDGSQDWGRIPDREKIWPRLLYHRHFMLTEFYGGIPPTAVTLRQAVAESYAQQLMKAHDSDSVELTQVVHQLTSRQEVLAGDSLTDPRKYEYTPLGRYWFAPEIIAPNPAQMQADLERAITASDSTTSSKADPPDTQTQPQTPNANTGPSPGEIPPAAEIAPAAVPQ